MARVVSETEYRNDERKVVFNSNTHPVDSLLALFGYNFVEGDKAFDYITSTEYMFGDDGIFHPIER